MKKFWNGVLAFGPAALLVGGIGGIILTILIIFLAGMLFSMTGYDLFESFSQLTGILVLFMMLCFYGSIFLSVLLNIADIIVFSIYAYKNPKLDANLKIIWSCIFISFQFLAFPVYWWIYIRKG